MLALPVAIAVVILAVVGRRGVSVFKKQGVAWGLTVLMIFAAIGIGYAKAPVNNPAPSPDYPSETIPPAAADSFVWDDAGVLSAQTVRELDSRNQRLWSRHSVSIGVVTCDNAQNLGEYAMKCAEEMNLGGYDFIVALDIAGENYWLIQGDGLRRDFTDDDCSDYAYDYMESWFAQGDYDEAVLSLTEALEVWYGDYLD